MPVRNYFTGKIIVVYNPHLHQRSSIRLKGYDYARAGLYFITICTKDRNHLFGHIENAGMVLNVFGQIAHNHWRKLHERFSKEELDVFQVMPNHMHGIILLNDFPVGAGLAPAHDNGQPARDNGQPARDNGDRAGASPAPTGPTTFNTIGNIVGAYKSLVANECLQIFKQNHPGEIMGKIWQRNYYEHIIRTDAAYLNICNYILHNPSNWKEDTFNK